MRSGEGSTDKEISTGLDLILEINETPFYFMYRPRARLLLKCQEKKRKANIF